MRGKRLAKDQRRVRNTSSNDWMDYNITELRQLGYEILYGTAETLVSTLALREAADVH